ncbi:MAG: hypothetical protein KDD63_04395 [Bacteroidetes bacterium]|nr:hypothetical protein [Bacteroidota bacterium]
MKESKLISLFQSIHPDEMRWLAKWVRSPYYNSNEYVIYLFDYIRKYGPEFTSNKLEKHKVYENLFPGKLYDDQRLRVLMFRLADLVEDFIVAERLKKDSFQKQRLLYAELGERNLYDQFDKKKQELLNQLDKAPYRDEYYYLAQWRLQHDHFFHPQTYRYQDSSIFLEEMMQNLDAFFLLAKIRYSTELRNRQNIFSEEHKIFLLDESKALVLEHPVFSHQIVFQVYTDILGLMGNPSDEVIFQRLQQNISQHLDLFRPSDQSSMVRYLINTTIQLYQKGKSGYLNNQFDLYELGLKKNLFLNDGLLPDGTFLNIIVTATVLGKLMWAEKFISEYAPMLPETKQVDAINLGKAYWYFSKLEFKESLNLLRQIESSDLQYLLRIKSLSLRNHFELFLDDDTYYELVSYESKAFQKFLRRHEFLSEDRILSYIKFISFIRKLASLKTNFQLSDKKLQKLKGKLHHEDSIIAKSWLEDKLTQLMQG